MFNNDMFSSEYMNNLDRIEKEIAKVDEALRYGTRYKSYLRFLKANINTPTAMEQFNSFAEFTKNIDYDQLRSEQFGRGDGGWLWQRL